MNGLDQAQQKKAAKHHIVHVFPLPYEIASAYVSFEITLDKKYYGIIVVVQGDRKTNCSEASGMFALFARKI